MVDPGTRRGIRLLFSLLASYRREAILSTLSALVWMVMVIIGPYLTKVVIDRAIEGERRDLLLPLVGAVLAAGVIKALGVGGRRYFAFLLSYRAETDLRNRIFEHIQRLEFNYHDEVATGELMSRSSSDLSQVRLVYAMLPITIANVAMFAVVIAVMVSIDATLGALVSLAVPMLLYIANTYARRVIHIATDVQQKLADNTAVIAEAIGGIRVVKSYGQEAQETEKIHMAAIGIYERSMELIKNRAIFIPLFELVAPIATAVILGMGGLRVIDGTLTPGEFYQFAEYMVILNFPLRLTGWFFAEIPRASAAGGRVLDLLKTAPEIADPAHPVDLPPGPGDVRFSNVAFRYPDGPPVLDGFDLHVPGGRSVALVGATGSGKSTVAYLLARFYDVTEGTVSLDGVDVRSVRLEELRNEVAVVFEETFLFSASIRDNISFGNPEATDEQVRLAARLAQAHGFIADTADGYESIIGERGYSLSGGQRQRIALARAVLRDPRVLILDDATSSVDAVTEDEIRDALKTVMAGRTTIIIAHRPSTLALADEVIFIDEGKVVASGTHTDLLERVPRYSAILANSEVG